MHSMADYKLFCFGNPILELDGQPVKLETRKSLALLVYLRINGLDFSRETLAALLWPEYDQQHAQANLRRTLASLHKYLRIDIIAADREKIGLRDSSRIWLDVEEFLDRLASRKAHPHPPEETCLECQSALESAIQLYRGDFMEGFNLSDCPDFDEWQFLQRESLRVKFSHILEMAARESAAQSQWDDAITYSRRWVAMDRLHEPAQRRLISLYTQAGQRSAALRQCDEIERLLKIELDQKPEKETLELIQMIRQGSASTPIAVPLTSLPQVEAHFASEPLLKSKLYIPFSRSKKVQRLRLVERLRGIEEHAITLLSASAGFGKTTALAEWAAESPLPVGWVSLDSGDNDPFRLLSYLMGALESTQSLADEDLSALLHFSNTTSLQVVLITLLHALEQNSTPFVLVLDDYQFIDARQVHELVAFMLDHLPPSMHLVISSRIDPPFPLARLRSSGQLLEIRTDDLRFTVNEAGNYLNQAMGLRLSVEDVAILEQQTEGWIVGLQMAALSLKDHEEPSRFIHTFSGSHRYVLDYLVEEVLSRQAVPIQEFLLQTSILSRLSGPLCDAVTGIRNWQMENLPPNNVVQPPYTGQQILEYLEHINLFLVPLDDERHWYRYHHLFADLLHARLQQAHPDWLPSIHLRAASWYEHNGQLSEAIQYALAAQDHETAVRLVEKISRGTLTHSRLVTLLGWVNQLPRKLIWHRPWLLINYAWALLVTGQFQGLKELLDKAEELVRSRLDSPDELVETRDMVGNITMIRAYIAFFGGDLAKTVHQASLAIQQVRKENLNLYSLVSLQLGEAYLILGEITPSEHHLREAIRTLNEIGDIHGAAVAYRRMTQLFRFQGRLAAMRDISIELLNRIESRFGQQSPVIGLAELGLGYHAYECNRLEEAESYFNNAVIHTQQLMQPYEEISAYTGLAWVFLARRDFERAGNVIEQGKQLIARYTIPPVVQDTLETTQVRLWLAQGNLTAAKSWTNRRCLNIDDHLYFPQENLYITLARVLIADQAYEQALALLERMAQPAQDAGRNGRLIEIQVLQALAAQVQGQEDVAFRYLEKSLRLGEAEEYLRVFADEGKPLETLLRAGLERKLWNDSRRLKYLERLLTAFQTQN